MLHKTDATRNQPGKVSGGKSLAPVYGTLLPDNIIGPIPGLIAIKLRKIQSFKNWTDFRQTFWKLVAQHPKLGDSWTQENLQRMEAGLAPFITDPLTGHGSQTKLQLNHNVSAQKGGDLYDLDNIIIVPPKVKQRSEL